MLSVRASRVGAWFSVLELFSGGSTANGSFIIEEERMVLIYKLIIISSLGAMA